jgi:predicted transcriptional regulator
MPKKILDKLSIYVPQKLQAVHLIERLIKLGDKCDRSINYLVVEAILEFLEREEKTR